MLREVESSLQKIRIIRRLFLVFLRSRSKKYIYIYINICVCVAALARCSEMKYLHYALSAAQRYSGLKLNLFTTVVPYKQKSVYFMITAQLFHLLLAGH